MFNKVKLLSWLLMGLCFYGIVQSQGFPLKPITLVVPFPPGGSTDQMARALAPKLQESLGQSIVIENKAGATGTIGSAFVKRSVADGYTLLVTSLGPLVIVPHLLSSIPYNPVTDFEYLTVGVQSPNVLIVSGIPFPGDLKPVTITRSLDPIPYKFFTSTGSIESRS